MYFKKGTNPKVKVKYFSLQPNFEKFLATVDLEYSADHMPADGSLFLLDQNDQIVQIRSQQDYERHWNLLKPASGRTPFITYALYKNMSKVTEALKRGPSQSKILFCDKDSYHRDRGAASDDYVTQDLSITVAECHGRNFRLIKNFILEHIKEKSA